VAQVTGALRFGSVFDAFDEAYRGFFASKDGPLDMRMNPHAGKSAYEVLATASERELADIFFEYGERSARRDASPLDRRTPLHRRAADDHDGFCEARRRRGASPGTSRTHPSGHARVSGASHRRQRRTRRLRDGLDSAVGRLRGAGRVVAISFHSLEDRIVKRKSAKIPA